jgi:molybdate/tungstate transport system substrate-binding protein
VKERHKGAMAQGGKGKYKTKDKSKEMKRLFCLLIVIYLIFSGSVTAQNSKMKEVIIFHAGSLSVPFKELATVYEKRNPGVKILLEPAGSLVCARKVTELKMPCDIVASSDYFVINELLIPKYATWGIKFATNDIVIAYTEKAKYSSRIDSSNWREILLRNDVIFARSDPNSDPCGYRTVFTFLLAEKYYNDQGLADKFLVKNKEYIRPKEVDLVALIESNAIDYMFQYKSVAVQHKLKYIDLPARINLSDPASNYYYHTVSTEVTGSTPGSKMKVSGDFINYSLTVLNDAPDKNEAIKFVDFLLSPEGVGIFRKNGQKPIIPFSTEQPDKIPAQLLEHLKK